MILLTSQSPKKPTVQNRMLVSISKVTLIGEIRFHHRWEESLLSDVAEPSEEQALATWEKL